MGPSGGAGGAERSETITDAAAALERGEVVAFPTETSWGLAAHAFSPEGLRRLFALKGREPDKPPPILIGDDAMLGLLVRAVPARARALIARHWPGALTLVLPAREGLPAEIVSNGCVGVRWSSHPVATALVRALGAPITGTSANRSGEPPAMTGAEVRRVFPDVPVVDGVAGGERPSTVVRVSDDGTLTVLRQGVVDPLHG